MKLRWPRRLTIRRRLRYPEDLPGPRHPERCPQHSPGVVLTDGRCELIRGHPGEHVVVTGISDDGRPGARWHRTRYTHWGLGDEIAWSWQRPWPGTLTATMEARNR